MSQGWVVATWLASMCLFMSWDWPSFPHWLHEYTALVVFPIVILFSVLVIIDLICSSNWWASKLTKAVDECSAFLSCMFLYSFKGVGTLDIVLSTRFLISNFFSCSDALVFSASVLGSARDPVRPLSLNSSARERKTSRFSWFTLASP